MSSGSSAARGALSMARCLVADAVRRSSGALASSSASFSVSSSSAPGGVSVSLSERIGTSLFLRRNFSSSSCFSARAALPSISSTSVKSTSMAMTSTTMLQRRQRQQHSDAAAASSSSSPSPKQRSDPEGLRLTNSAVERVRWLLAKREAKAKEQGEGGPGAGGGATTPAATVMTAAVLRLTVEAGGCSGFSYVFSLDEGGVRKGDRAFGERGEVHVEAAGTAGTGTGTAGTAAAAAFDDPRRPLLTVDPVSFDLVKGSTVDFEQELIKAGFEVVDNPNAEAGCGCGSSFAAKVF